MKLSVTGCYALAWKSFSKWWIPLCVISGMVVVLQGVPRMLVHADVRELKATTHSFMSVVLKNDQADVEDVTRTFVEQASRLLRKLTTFGLYLFPVLALLTVILLMTANTAVKNRQQKRKPFSTLVYIACVHVVMAIVKILAFFFFVVPGVYLYVKLLFVSLIMLEDNTGAKDAIRISWRMTEGNFWQLFLLVLMNTGIQVLVLPTIIGEIPVTGFANTARAAAFQMIRKNGDKVS